MRFENCFYLLESQVQGGEPLRMADPKDLQEAAKAIHDVRALPAVQRHKELDVPLRQAEDWPGKNTIK